MRIPQARPTRLIAIAVAAGLAVALSGCGALLVVDNANGAGTCHGHSATIATTQDTTGENFTVTYTGPANVSLFLSPSVYSNNSFNGQFSERVLVVGGHANINEPDVALYKLDPTTTGAGWSTTGSGNSTTYAFSGQLTELLDGNSPFADLILGMTGPIGDTIAPYSVLVDCDSSDTSQLLVSDDNSSVVSTAPTFTAAAPLFPNNVIIDPLVVTSSVADSGGNGVTGTIRFPASATTAFNSLIPVTAQVGVFPDDSNIPNTDFSSLYAQVLTTSADASFVFDGAIDVTADNGFTFAGTGSTLAAGKYILVMLLINSDASSIKTVFTEASYSSANGFSISDPFVPATPAAGTTLATTGLSSGTTGVLAGGSALLALLGVGIVFATRRRSLNR